jgi:exodeoxyribonuclease X
LIRVIDFEATTGDDGGRVIEAGWCDLLLDPLTQRWTIGGSGGYLCGIPDDAPMPADARAVHHIRRGQLAGLPRFDPRLLYEDAMRAGAVCLAAQGADFEAQHIMGPLPLICTYKAALRVWPDAVSHKNFGLLYMLEDAGVEFDQDRAWPPHRAEADAYATAVILREIMAAGVTGAELFEWTRMPAILPRCPIGQYRGRKWAEVDGGFLQWILRTIKDRDDLTYCAALELDRREDIQE